MVSVLTSLDGVFEGPGGDLSVLPFEDAFNDHNLTLLERAGTLVYGGTWFAANRRHWAAVAADPAASDRDRRMAGLVTGMDSLVISDSLPTAPDVPGDGPVRVVRRDGAAAAITDLKAGDGGDLLIFGSVTTWNPLLEQGLVDELIVLVGAGLAGSGTPLYRGPARTLRLRESRVLPGSELVALHYDAGPRN